MTTTSSHSATVTLPTDEEILITREFDAPKHLVYRAYTEPDLVRRWWHARRGTMTVVEIDLRVGGGWRYAMVADGGQEVAFHGTYREIVPDERIVTTEIYEGVPEPEPGEEVVDTMTLAEANGRTTLDDPRHVPEPRGAGHDRRLGDGGRAAGRARPARGARRQPALTDGVGHRARGPVAHAHRLRRRPGGDRAASERG